MRFAFLILASLLAAPVMAQQVSTMAKVPTGSDVKGCAYFYMDMKHGTGAKIVCPDKANLAANMAAPDAWQPPYVVGSSGGNGNSK